MFAASSQYPGIPMKIIAITANTVKFNVNFPVSPCGSCRQVMSEYENKQNQPIKVILMGVSGNILVIESIAGLLPFMFHAEELKQK
jgi:cytidine deaminase